VAKPDHIILCGGAPAPRGVSPDQLSDSTWAAMSRASILRLPTSAGGCPATFPTS